MGNYKKMKEINKCQVCGFEIEFFPGPDDQYSVGDSHFCPNCDTEYVIDWDGEEGTDEVERNIGWYTREYHSSYNTRWCKYCESIRSPNEINCLDCNHKTEEIR